MGQDIIKPVTCLAEEACDLEATELQMFFKDLFEVGSREDLEQAVISKMKGVQLDMQLFDVVEGAYSRTILARGTNRFEAMVARWSNFTATAVHGHPDYALYLLLEGRLGIENFVYDEGGLKCVGTSEMVPGDYFIRQGRPYTFSNAIHRITVLEESLSLHVYSDDATKGSCFIDYPEPSPFLMDTDTLAGSGLQNC